MFSFLWCWTWAQDLANAKQALCHRATFLAIFISRQGFIKLPRLALNFRYSCLSLLTNREYSCAVLHSALYSLERPKWLRRYFRTLRWIKPCKFSKGFGCWCRIACDYETEYYRTLNKQIILKMKRCYITEQWESWSTGMYQWLCHFPKSGKIGKCLKNGQMGLPKKQALLCWQVRASASWATTPSHEAACAQEPEEHPPSTTLFGGLRVGW